MTRTSSADAARQPLAEARSSAAFAGQCTLGASAMAVGVALLARRAPAFATLLAVALRGIRADLIADAADILARGAYALLACWTGYVWLHQVRARIRLTRTEVIVRSGVVVRSDITVPLGQILKLEVRRSPAGVLLGYGDLVVDDGSARPPVAWHVPAPDRLVEAIRAAQDASGSNPPASRSGGPAGDR